MSERFLRKGHNATRLGLPDWDLSTEAAARAVVHCAQQALEAGEHILLWAALLCMPWSSWQYVSASVSPQSAAKIEKARRESIQMLTLFLWACAPSCA